MSRPRGEQDEGGRWEGYSDYRLVSGRIARTIEDAVEAYAVIDARHSEGATVSPDLASDARASIMAAAMMLQHEMERERDDADKPYDEILSRWEGEEGLLQKMDGIQLRKVRPGWLHKMVLDIRRAGWELGYLQAGRTGSREPEDSVEAEAEAMFQ